MATDLREGTSVYGVTTVVLSRLKDENGGKVYQGSELHHFRDTTTKTCQDQALADLKSLDEQMRACLEWSDVELMRSILELGRFRRKFK